MSLAYFVSQVRVETRLKKRALKELAEVKAEREMLQQTLTEVSEQVHEAWKWASKDLRPGDDLDTTTGILQSLNSDLERYR